MAFDIAENILSQEYSSIILTDILLEIVSVEVEHEIVNKVVSVAHDDQRQLVRQFGLFQEILHPTQQTGTVVEYGTLCYQ
jgi:hypothetical protein